MRLKLDKLFLSAGLALAVIATTIPVGAAVHTVTEDGKTTVTVEEGFTKDVTTLVSDTDFAKIVAPAADPVTKEFTKITTAAATGTVTKNNKKTDVLNQASFNNYLSQNGIENEVVAAYDISYSVKQDVTYAITGYVYELTEAEKTAVAKEISDNNTNGTTDSTEQDAAKANALAAARKAAGLPEDDGTSVVVTKGAASYSSDSDTAPTKYTVTVTDKVTYTTAVTDLSSYSGYTYDLVLGKAAENEEPVVLKFDKSGNVSEVTDGITVDSDYDVAISLTDLTTSNIYVLATKTVSTSNNLLFGTDDADASSATQKDTTNGESVVIKREAAPETAAKTAIDTVVKNNSLTHVAYFDITAYNNVDPTQGDSIPATTKTYTFKIAIPTDLPAVADGYTRTYKVIRYHGTDAEILDAEVADGYITFSSNLFSDYALAYVDVAADTTEDQTNNETESATEAGTETTTAGSSTTSTTTSTKTADNSMMPLFMTTLLLALCAGSLAIYKEKKTN